MGPVLIEVPFSEVAPYARAAAKEHVAVTETRRTRWYKWPQVGFCGLIELGTAGGVRPRARIKGVYVFPEERGAGKGTRMTLELMEIAGLLGYVSLEAFALNPRWYEENGWHRTGLQLRSGAWKVETA